MLYLPHSDDVIKILWVLGDFVPEYYHAKFVGDKTTNKGATEYQNCPAYIGLKTRRLFLNLKFKRLQFPWLESQQFLFDFRILFIVFAVCQTLFS